jgi:hypothetical protein
MPWTLKRWFQAGVEIEGYLIEATIKRCLEWNRRKLAFRSNNAVAGKKW